MGECLVVSGNYVIQMRVGVIKIKEPVKRRGSERG